MIVVLCSEVWLDYIFWLISGGCEFDFIFVVDVLVFVDFGDELELFGFDDFVGDFVLC